MLWASDRLEIYWGVALKLRNVLNYVILSWFVDHVIMLYVGTQEHFISRTLRLLNNVKSLNGKSKLKPSTLALRKGETTESTFISGSEDKTGVLDFIERKIAKATMIPQSHGEAFNILRYEIGQKYDSHYDAFNPDEYGPQPSQRVASFLLYLSSVEEGGETMFPLENGSAVSSGFEYKRCVGLKVKPRQGDGLLFYSLFPNGTIDRASLHGSCPVIEGEKWVATKWIRDQIELDEE
uniref:Fe2OG dioxygenase domain-containing protein n=1 Tax=Salix viminalis TaxID=40686 RepID=A0A6N2LZK3_SALVM